MQNYHEKLKEIHSAIKTMSVFIASIKPEQLNDAENVNFLGKVETMAFEFNQDLLKIRTSTEDDEIIAAAREVEAFFDSVHYLNDYILNETDFTSEDALEEIKSRIDDVANDKNAALVNCEILDEKLGG